MEQKKTPVYVLTGFLGSGKTTLLKEMLTAEKSAGRTPAVVLNELGEANVEKSYFNEETLIEKLNGCICCTIQTDLTDDLLDFFTYSKKKPDVMFIEGTGVADPLQVMDGLTDPRLQAFIDIKSVIGVVDAARYIEYQSMFSSSKEVREVLRSHLLHSSLLILNKVDECDVRTLEKVKKKIDKAKPSSVPVIEASFGDVLHEELMMSRFEHTSENSQEQRQEIQHSHSHFQALHIEPETQLQKENLKNWLESLPEQVVRVKGIVHMKGEGKRAILQYSPGSLSLEPLSHRDEDGGQRLIIIGYNINSADINESFSKMM